MDPEAQFLAQVCTRLLSAMSFVVRRRRCPNRKIIEVTVRAPSWYLPGQQQNKQHVASRRPGAVTVTSRRVARYRPSLPLSTARRRGQVDVRHVAQLNKASGCRRLNFSHHHVRQGRHKPARQRPPADTGEPTRRQSQARLLRPVRYAALC